MSGKNQRWLAAAGLASALLLAAPAPSMAAGRWKPAAEASSFAVRVWSWLESLGIAPRLQAVVREKEGSAIDPNGVPRPADDPTPPSSTSTATTPTGSTDGTQ